MNRKSSAAQNAISKQTIITGLKRDLSINTGKTKGMICRNKRTVAAKAPKQLQLIYYTKLDNSISYRKLLEWD